MEKMTYGCVNKVREFATGTTVSVMPRSIAQTVARRHNQPLGNFYTPNEDAILKAEGYMGVVRSRVLGAGGVLMYQLKVKGRHLWVTLPASAVFGPAHHLGDVVDVGTTLVPGNPPTRRVFAGYSIDAAFDPVVLTYNSPDTTSILDDMSSAVVALDDAELWDIIHPVEAELVPLPPAMSASAFMDGEPVAITTMTRAQWCELYDQAN